MKENPRSEQPALPHHIQLAWKLQGLDSDDSDKGLNAQKVVHAAIELADKEGLNGLSFRKLSQRLGFTTMAVYRHVRSRGELLILMVDTSLGVPPSSIREATTWQEALRRWGQALFERYQLHPWLLDVPAFGLPTTPNHILWVEYFLMAMGSSRLTLQHKLDAALLIDGHARHIAHLRRPGQNHAADEAEVPGSTWLRLLIDGSTHPFYSEVLDEGVLEDEAGPDFEFGLDCIIDGIAARAQG